MSSNSTLRLRFTSQSEFWLGVEREHPLIGQKAVNSLLPFATSYLCEMVFSTVAALKTKHRSQRNIEQELRTAISYFKPRFERMCSEKKAHNSHEIHRADSSPSQIFVQCSFFFHLIEEIYCASGRVMAHCIKVECVHIKQTNTVK